MPVYEYECNGCNQIIEVSQRITEDPLTTCPQCGGSEIKKIISQTSFVLKGSGWYVTDYKKNSASASQASPKSKNTTEACATCSENKSCSNSTAAA